MPACVVIANRPRDEIKQVLICTGGLSLADVVVQTGARLAKALGAKVTLMHVATNVPSMYTGLRPIEETLEELLQTNTPVAQHLRTCAGILNEYEVPSDIKLRHGNTVYEIVREIDLEAYDFIVIGASGASTGVKEWFMGNVTKEIIEFVNIPIMVVNQTHAKKLDDFSI
jgi:nucleotide-binding universal stress UspA family protein